MNSSSAAGAGRSLLCWGLIALGLIVPCGSAAATTDQPIVIEHPWLVQQFLTSHGLPQNSIVTMLQTTDGYLWFGTHGGLARYDGVQFTVFQRHGLEAGAPPANRITALLEDARHRLWIGMEGGGLALYDGGRFTPLAVCSGRCSAWRLLPKDDQHLWALTSHGAFEIDIESLQGRQVPGLESEDLHAGEAGPNGDFYAVSREQLWYVTDDDATIITPWSAQASTGGAGRLPDGRLWFSTSDGLYLLRPDGDDWQRVPALTHVIDIAADPAQPSALWIAERTGRLLRLEDFDFNAAPEPFTPINTRLLRSLMVDRDGTLWVGSDGQGLYRVRRSDIGQFGGAGTALDKPVMPLEHDGAGGVWLGLLCGGLVRVDEHGRMDEDDRRRQGTFADECASALHLGIDGVLWAGFFHRGLRRRDPSGHWSSVAAWPPSRVIRALYESPDGVLWIGADTGLFTLLDGRVEPIAALQDLSITSIVAARHGGLWITSDRGLFRLQGREQTRHWSESDGLSGRFVRSVYEDERGVLWVGTYGDGLTRIEGDHMAVFRHDRGLGENVVSCIIEDEQQRLWMSGNRGLQYIPRAWLDTAAKDGRSVANVSFYESSGLPVTETNGGAQPACNRDGAGRLWFPLISGAAVVTPSALPVNPEPPPVRIESVQLAGRTLGLGPGPLTLEPLAHDLEIRFAALNFTAPERTLFRFRLAGHDDAWSEVGRRRIAYYPVLPYGEYTFEVASRSETGVWSDAPARLPIVHRAPWYLRSSGWPLTTLVLVIVLLAVLRFRGRALRARAAALETLIQARTDELERANRQLRRQAQTDPLTGVGNRSLLSSMLEKLWAESAQRRQWLSVLMLDVDHFKHYNDHFGHVSGDEALRTIARTIDDLLDEHGQLFRYGGEEFAILLPDTTLSQACAIAEQLREAILHQRMPHPGSPLQCVTISVGVAACVATAEAASRSLIETADQALYRAKHRGRNRVDA